MTAHDFGPLSSRVPITVYGNDLGLGGVTDISAALRFMDRGRVETIEAMCADASQVSWLSRYMVNVYRLDAVFHRGARVGDHLVAETGLHQHSSHRAAFDQRIADAATGVVIADATVEVTFVDTQGQLAAVPEELEQQLAGSDLEDLVPATLKFTPARKLTAPPFSRRFKVYYEDTDTQSIAYHATYVRFCERALQDLLEECCSMPPFWRWLDDHRPRVTKLAARYTRPARLGDDLEVRLWVREASDQEALVELRLAMNPGADETITTHLLLGVAFESVDGEPTPVPAEVRAMALAESRGHVSNGQPQRP